MWIIRCLMRRKTSHLQLQNNNRRMILHPLLSAAARAPLTSVSLTPSRQRRLAVNTDPRESDPTPADEAVLARWEAAGQALAAARPADPRAQPSPLDRALPLAPWLLALLGLLAVLEPLAANLVAGGRVPGAAR